MAHARVQQVKLEVARGSARLQHACAIQKTIQNTHGVGQLGPNGPWPGNLQKVKANMVGMAIKARPVFLGSASWLGPHVTRVPKLARVGRPRARGQRRVRIRHGSTFSIQFCIVILSSCHTFVRHSRPLVGGRGPPRKLFPQYATNPRTGSRHVAGIPKIRSFDG